MRFSLKRSPRNAFPKLNVEGSNPFARFRERSHRGPRSRQLANTASETARVPPLFGNARNAPIPDGLSMLLPIGTAPAQRAR